MAMKGWRRIGIVLSVIWFFGFGLFLWHELVESEVAPYVVALKACSQIEYSGDTDDPDVRMKRFDRAEKCRSNAKLEWEERERERWSTSLALAMVIGVDLVTIALGWLIAWGLLSVGRWVHRGFAAK